MDIEVILHSDNTDETDIYYKDTNSAHPKYSKENLLKNLAKRIIVFVSNNEKSEITLKELKKLI